MDNSRLLTPTSGPVASLYRARGARLLMTGAALRVPVSGAKGTALPIGGSDVPFGHVRASEPDS